MKSIEKANMAIEKNSELSVIDVTDGTNGYPVGLHHAVVGFTSIQDAETVARELNGEVVELTKRDGWQFWTGSGRVFSAYDLETIYADKGYTTVYPMTEERFIDYMDVKGSINDCDTIERMKYTLSHFADIWDDVQTLGDDEFLLVTDGDRQILPRHAMSYSYDTHSYIIGVEFRND